MADTPAIEEHPPEASASGQNTLCIGCATTQQSMHYAACLRRITMLEEGDADTPSAYRGRGTCEEAIGHRECAAFLMRGQEITAGKAMYFIPRGSNIQLAPDASKWIAAWYRLQEARNADSKGASVTKAEMETLKASLDAPAPNLRNVPTKRKPKADPVVKPAAPAKSKDMFDTIGELGNLAEAISGAMPTPAASTRKTEPAPVVEAKPSQPVRPLPVALPGETPMQMALRLKKEKASA